MNKTDQYISDAIVFFENAKNLNLEAGGKLLNSDYIFASELLYRSATFYQNMAIIELLKETNEKLDLIIKR